MYIRLHLIILLKPQQFTKNSHAGQTPSPLYETQPKTENKHYATKIE